MRQSREMDQNIRLDKGQCLRDFKFFLSNSNCNTIFMNTFRFSYTKDKFDDPSRYDVTQRLHTPESIYTWNHINWNTSKCVLVAMLSTSVETSTQVCVNSGRSKSSKNPTQDKNRFGKTFRLTQPCAGLFTDIY